MRERITVSVLAMLVATMGAAGTTMGLSTDPDPSPPDAAPSEVEIDGNTGELTSPPALPGTNVTIRVTNVTPSKGTFDLHGPKDTAFLNQTARHDGVVEFWHMPALPGTYNVTQRTTDGEIRPVVEEIEIVDPSTLTTEGCWWWWGDCDRCYEGSYTRKIAEGERWSPLMIANSPSDGVAKATSSTGEVRSIFFAPAGWESETEIASAIGAEDGESWGAFQNALWGIYQRDGYCDGQSRTAAVIDWEPGDEEWIIAKNLTGDSRFTDADNVREFEFWNRGSIEFDATYKGRDKVRVGPIEDETKGSTISGIWGEISIGTSAVTFDLIEFSATEEVEDSYRYEFHAHDRYDIHEIEDGPGWAFCRPSKAEC